MSSENIVYDKSKDDACTCRKGSHMSTSMYNAHLYQTYTIVPRGERIVVGVVMTCHVVAWALKLTPHRDVRYFDKGKDYYDVFKHTNTPRVTRVLVNIYEVSYVNWALIHDTTRVTHILWFHVHLPRGRHKWAMGLTPRHRRSYLLNQWSQPRGRCNWIYYDATLEFDVVKHIRGRHMSPLWAPYILTKQTQPPRVTSIEVVSCKYATWCPQMSVEIDATSSTRLFVTSMTKRRSRATWHSYVENIQVNYKHHQEGVFHCERHLKRPR